MEKAEYWLVTSSGLEVRVSQDAAASESVGAFSYAGCGGINVREESPGKSDGGITLWHSLRVR